jgi:formamidase
MLRSESRPSLISSIVPFDSQSWGYSITLPNLGSLDHPDHETKPFKSIWDFHGAETSSRHIPHVSFHGRPHPGVIGNAPSQELLDAWNEREAQAAGEGAEGLSLPLSTGAYVGQELDPELRERIYREGARTAPGREHGGNIDIGSLTRGSKMYLVGQLRRSGNNTDSPASLCTGSQTIRGRSTLL